MKVWLYIDNNNWKIFESFKVSIYYFINPVLI